MRCVYLRSSLSKSGRDGLRGRRLVDALKAEGDAFLLGFMIVPAGNAAGFPADVMRDVIDEVAFAELAPDIVFIEGGFFTGTGGSWKIDPAIASAFVASGGVVVVADVEANKLDWQREDYLDARDFLGASASYRGREPVGGYDDVRCWKGNKQILCRRDDMVVSDWLRPVFDGVPEILAGLPVRLASWGSILASGNTSSTWSNATDGIPGPDNLPFASVAKQGAGYVALICGAVSSDVWLEGCPHNTRWLVNLARFLVAQARDEKRRELSHVLSTEVAFLSHSHADGDRVKNILRILRSEHGLKTWIDHEEILPGDELTPALLSAVSTATVFILFWSATAKASNWVELEWRAALENDGARVLIAQFDSTALPSQLQDLVRIESASSKDAAIAADVVDTLQRVDRRRRIAELKAKGGETAKNANLAQAPAKPAPKRIMSLTRKKPQMTALAPISSLPSVRTKASTLAPVAKIKSDYRIDLLCFVDAATLLAGSSRFDSADIETAKRLGLLDAFERVNVPTSMDGCFADHASTRRHIAYGGDDVTVVYRGDGARGQPIRCDEGASVHSAAWSPDGALIAVASTNRLTIATAAGNILKQEARYPDTPLSVAWAPSKNLICGSLGKVSVLADGASIWEWKTGTKDAERIACVAVSPCARLFACTLRNGRVKVWNEKGALLGEFDGATGDSAYWHASRALAFSADSRFLVQAAPIDSEGFSVLDLTTGLLVKVAEGGTDLVAWSPSQPDLLATASDQTISFWRVAFGD